MGTTILTAKTFRFTHLHNSKELELLGWLDRLGWFWSIDLRQEGGRVWFGVSLYFGPEDSQNGSTHGGATTVEGALEKLRQYAADHIFPTYSTLNVYARRFFIDAKATTDQLDLGYSGQDLKKLVERMHNINPEVPEQ